MRERQAVVISQTMQSVERTVLESWLNLNGEAFDKFVKEVCGWSVEGSSVVIPLNKENEARGTVVRENVKFDRKFDPPFMEMDFSKAEWLIRLDSQNSRE
jgi:translation initiation factor 3 subunit K